ncbi:MAG: (d)CMP kinase [Parachlamydiaceae bacterium]|nr:(d)CMP kinase [Parachlamydiaceae bacterium]
MLITIDGPVATGKSSIAKKLAEELGYIYFDTGAMYRGLTWFVLQKKIDVNNPIEVADLLDQFVFEIKIKHGDRLYFVNKENVTDAIRRDQVTSLVSEVSANPVVREKLVKTQREFAVGVNSVFEGRDMGSVVFPDADLKIFLTARIEVRAKRRYLELKAKFPEESGTLTIEKAIEDINKRDAYDTERVNSPLIQARDAIIVDTSDKTIDEVVFEILELKDQKRFHVKSDK